jgi:non-heme chloroperoxidase
LGGLIATVAAGLPGAVPAQTAKKANSPLSPEKGNKTMSTITTKDGAEIYYKDWGKGPVVTFSHGWPLNADAWDGQMLFLAQTGFRVVAHDRRGHGRSSQASEHNDMNGYADDQRSSRRSTSKTRRWLATPPVAARSLATLAVTAPNG